MTAVPMVTLGSLDHNFFELTIALMLLLGIACISEHWEDAMDDSMLFPYKYRSHLAFRLIVFLVSFAASKVSLHAWLSALSL